MKSAYRPGPWRIVPENTPPFAKPGSRVGPAICSIEKAFTTISIHAEPDNKPCPDVAELDAMGEANARLIAAAPEMLEALLECIKVYEEKRDAQPSGHLWPDPNHILHARKAIQKATGQN